MKDYILYHNAEKMGYDLEGDRFLEDDEDLEGESMSDELEDLHWENPDNSAAIDDESLFAIATSNRKETEECIGHRVWVIQGQAGTFPREYYLHGYFYADGYQLKPETIARKKFKYRIYRNSDFIFRPIDQNLRLNREFWFLGFRKCYQNFRKGFREIVDSAFVAEIEEFYSKGMN